MDEEQDQAFVFEEVNLPPVRRTEVSGGLEPLLDMPFVEATDADNVAE